MTCFLLFLLWKLRINVVSVKSGEMWEHSRKMCCSSQKIWRYLKPGCSIPNLEAWRLFRKADSVAMEVPASSTKKETYTQVDEETATATALHSLKNLSTICWRGLLHSQIYALGKLFQSDI